jgi:siroheme synthase
MHASGAIITKAIPFLLIPAAVLMPAIPTWVAIALLLLGIVQIVTDVTWSTKSSDWAKFRREQQYSRSDTTET